MAFVEHKPSLTKTLPPPPPPPSAIKGAILENIKPIEVKLSLAPSIAIRPEVLRNEVAHAIGTAIMKQYPDAVKLSVAEKPQGYTEITVKLNIYQKGE